MHGCMYASGLPPVYATLVATPKGGERISLQGLYQTRANVLDAATSIPPVCLPSTKDSFMACRHHATNSSELESGISLPQVSFMSKSRSTAKSACVCMVDMTKTCGREILLSNIPEFVAW